MNGEKQEQNLYKLEVEFSFFRFFFKNGSVDVQNK